MSAAEGAQIAIGFEDGPGDPKLAVTARRGTTGWQVNVTGTPAHSSQIFREDIGYGAVYEVARIINCLPRADGGGGAPDVQPRRAARRHDGRVRSGADARHARSARRTSSLSTRWSPAILRALSAEQFRTARETMEKIVAASLPHTHATITFDEGYPPMAPTEGNARLLAMYDQVSRDLGFGAVTAVSPDRAGAADVSFVAGKINTIIDGVGLMGQNDHTADETADLDDAAFPDEAHGRAALPHSAGGRGEVSMMHDGTRDSGFGSARGSAGWRLATGA